MQPSRSRVVVIGASLAGLLAAAAAAERAESVLVLERYRFPTSPTARGGVPQGSHQHVLLHRGLLAAEQLLPGLRDDLVRAIRAAQSGDFYVDPALSSTIVLEEGDRTLTARQREILQMLADGMQTEAVARKLGLSTETVRTHTKRILAKLHADTRTQAVAIAIRNGLIE